MKKHILFVAAENDGIVDCKAGGMADVVRDVPRQIAAFGDDVSVITPSYGRLHHNSTPVKEFMFTYRGELQKAFLLENPGKKRIPGIRHYILHHPDFRPGDIAKIYFNDPDRPFYTDTLTFSLFGAAVAELMVSGILDPVDIVHLHDWHTSFLLMLREYHSRFTALKNIRMVYSIHNLAIQGIRPLDNDYGSLKAFFPEMEPDVDTIRDPRYHDCFNLMAVGIRLADAVHTVSPSYMEDIQKPSMPPGFIGGEGLEADLKDAARQGRLFGILNGCNYKGYSVPEAGRLFPDALKVTLKWLQMTEKKYKARFLAHTGEKLLGLIENPPKFICGSVARLTPQKFYFFKEDPSLMASLLEALEKRGGVFVVVGTGAPEYERLFRAMSRRHENFIFINGQSEEVIDGLYAGSDLYVMPSLFEPCGISQMLAMRNAQPCLVHYTGGLKDTVKHLETGFVFKGETLEAQKADFIKVFKEALEMYFNRKKQWKEIQKAASMERFTWEKSVASYYTQLYKLSRPKTT
ncbi:glycogen synthase [Robertkochia sediminum]|uniref:glycogen synthase n=1 Tax=Robertkochia sediminum TaxID=2785326 RepID=UPI0019314E55|nr:glycogen/starch synthase [Robertkochia sediminum]MBL7472782.1 glycogen/starch synthase [Robertkochia sediminum]